MNFLRTVWFAQSQPPRFPPLFSKPEHFVDRPTLRTARTVNVRVVRVNKRAPFASENIVRAPGGFKPFAAKFVIYRHARQRPEQGEHVEEEQLVRRHG